LISKKIFAPDGSNTRFLSDFIIRSEQFCRVYNYVYDVGGVDGTVDGATGLFVRVLDAPKAPDLITIDKWDLVDNSISFYTAPQAGTRVYIEVATTPEEFGTTLIEPSVVRAEAAAVAAEASAVAALVSENGAAADLALTNADVVLTHADVVTTNADVVLTNADVGLTNADVVLTGLDVDATNADVVLTNADVVSTGLDVAATNADVVLTHADVVLTHADVVLTHADVVTTNADVVLTNADVLAADASAVEAAASAAILDADKIVAKTTATGSAELPVGTTAQRDGTPSAGMIRFNSDDAGFEGHDGTAWGGIGADPTAFLTTATDSRKTAGTTIFNDNLNLSFGTGEDARFRCNGSHFYLDLKDGIGNFYIRDGITTRFTFDDSGAFTATGNITAYSDRRLKKNIEIIPNAMDKILQLSGYTFDRKDVNTKRQTGVIAQEIKAVLPEAVIEDENGKLSVAYGNIVGLLIEGMKDLHTKIEILEKRKK
jgi:hypothetical protein